LTLLGLQYLTLVITSLLTNRLLLLTLYITIQSASCYCICDSAYTIGKPALLSRLYLWLLRSSADRRSAFHAELLARERLGTTVGTEHCSSSRSHDE
jgi:hypothetical protein